MKLSGPQYALGVARLPRQNEKITEVEKPIHQQHPDLQPAVSGANAQPSAGGNNGPSAQMRDGAETRAAEIERRADDLNVELGRVHEQSAALIAAIAKRAADTDKH
jgi:hypothetical protein